MYHVVVTGCTQGIGLSFAQSLASKKMNLILVGRNQARLEETQKNLTEKYEIEAEIIVADLSQGPHIYKIVKKGLENKDIGILVNCVGIGFTHPMFFNEVS